MRAIKDFRSDTVTRPTIEMLKSISSKMAFEDCVLGQDPDVASFEAKMANEFGKEAGLFVMTGTMANQVSMMASGANSLLPASAIGHRNCHIFRWESNGIVNSRLMPIPISEYTFEQVKKHAIVQNDVHKATTKVVILENPLDGVIQPLSELKKIHGFSQEHDIHVHLDGCRIWHAAIGEKTSLHQYGEVADSISLCFSKGLGAPVGAMILGTAAFIERCKYYRKVMGGGTRQTSGFPISCSTNPYVRLCI